MAVDTTLKQWTDLKILLFLGSLLIVFLLSRCSGSSQSQGARLYTEHCQQCHGERGEGFRELYPPLAGADFLEQRSDEIACILRYGIDEPLVINGTTYETAMPSNAALSDIEIANLVNYIRNSWGNKGEFIPADKVKEQLSNCP